MVCILHRVVRVNILTEVRAFTVDALDFHCTAAVSLSGCSLEGEKTSGSLRIILKRHVMNIQTERRKHMALLA